MTGWKLIWRIKTVCRCVIETAILTKEETEQAITNCPYHGKVTIESIKNVSEATL